MKPLAKYVCALLVAVGLFVSTGNAAQAQDAGAPALVEAVDAGTPPAPVDPSMAAADPAPASTPAAEEPKASPFPSPQGTVDELGTIRKAYDGVMHGSNRWRALAALLLVGMTYMTRRYGGTPIPVLNKPFLPPKLYAWFNTDRGGVALVFLLASGGALGHALAAGVEPTIELFENVMMLGVSAAGTYVMARRLASPADKKEASS